jgi:SAM-dependent methyltransferase
VNAAGSDPQEGLRKLINASGPEGRGRWATRLLARIDARRLARQRQIDHAIVGRLGELADAISRLEALQHRLTETVGQLQAWLTVTSERGDETAGRLIAFIPDQERALRGLGEGLHRVSQRSPSPTPLDGSQTFVLETFDAGLGGLVSGFRDGGADGGDGVYLGFEQLFRGSEDTIAERQRAYLPLLEGRSPVIDVGCGRGEMLELLRGEGIAARGVDMDAAMVERCLAKGLEVTCGDAVRYLEGSDEGSLGAVFAAQVIEHLPYTELLRFLRTVLAKLRPEGVVVMETVNPHSPQALKHFWIDPTHQHPLFPEIVLALCRLTGYGSGYIWYPGGSGDPQRDRVEQLDYAVVAQRGRLPESRPAS